MKCPNCDFELNAAAQEARSTECSPGPRGQTHDDSAIPASAAPSVVITRNERNEAIAVTRQDAEGHILETLWERPEGDAERDVERLTDEQILSIAARETDTLDATRVHEQRGTVWHSTTIFDGDAALLRFARAAIDAAIAQEEKGK